MKQQLLAVSGAALAVMSVLAGCASHDRGDGKKVFFLIPTRRPPDSSNATRRC
jgi:hypothetical protein